MDSILIVDDEKDILESLRRMLRGIYEVDIAESPFDALKLLQNRLYHVIVSDQRMPEMTGVEFLEKAKKLSPLSTRILLTGYTDIESVIDSINRGNIYRYISKPWEPEELKLTLRQANEAFRLKKELEDKNKHLEKALADLTLLDRAKGRFLSLISHELNTPVTILNSFIELVLDKKSELSEDVSKALSSMQGASDRLSEIVKQVIDYVGLESAPGLTVERVSLAEIFQNLYRDFGSKAQNKKVSLNIHVPPSLNIQGDRRKLEMAFTYLIGEAIIRAPQKSAIDIKAYEADGVANLELYRDGDSWGAESFQVLETGQSQMHHQRNLGVGLALFKRVIESHSGSFRFDVAEGRPVILIHLKK